MKIIEKQSIYLFEAPFVSGFTKAEVNGFLPEDVQTIADGLRGQADFAYMSQEHGAQVVKIDTGGKHVCDGIFTEKKNLVLIVKTADCLPLLFYSKQEKTIGAIHMGWRSAQAGVLANIPYDLESFSVIAGCGMRKCCYRVGEEFLEKKEIAPFVEKKEEALYFDPIRFAKKELKKKGLISKNFLDLTICSFCGDKETPSFRKTGTEKRTLSFITRI